MGRLSAGSGSSRQAGGAFPFNYGSAAVELALLKVYAALAAGSGCAAEEPGLDLADIAALFDELVVLVKAVEAQCAGDECCCRLCGCRSGIGR
ncbi:hypothetical protein ACFFGT_10530 [Mucilaginibacter angelicae]|uniref:Uncharacterized protein n=1 Tax=Mucilaginibacter angelicae TaxID=869718 RepID=A0ABV6L5D4_9SPHI